MPIPGTGSGGATGATSGRVTVSQPPAVRRSDLPSVTPSRSTAPDSASSAALVRLIPSIRARAATRRCPASASGTGTRRTSAIIVPSGVRPSSLRPRGVSPSGIGPSGIRSGGIRSSGVGLLLRGAAVVADADEGEDRDERGGHDDEDVGDVADEESVVVQEVHHVTGAEPGVAKEPVVEV